MTGKEKLLKVLSEAIEEHKENGYIFIDLAPNVKIFANDNYADIKIELGNGVDVSTTIARKDEE